ncbi:MAG: glycosyltransferase family 4 protein [Romboutsia sp.]
MKKCLHVLPMDKLSGAEKMALIICENLVEYEPIVVCGGVNLQQIFEDRNIKSYSINFNNKNLSDITKELSNIIKENDIKIIHVHDNKASINAYATKLINKLDVKIISHIHSCYPWLTSFNANKIIDSIMRKKYDLNIACGNQVYDFYLENTNYANEDNIKILSNAIDIDDIEKQNIKNIDIYRKYNIPKNKNIIGYVGRLIELKGLIPFIKEFSNYKEEFKDSVILLVGSGEKESEIKDLIKSLKLEEYFILTGNQENVYEIYPIIDVFILPSLYEGLPMVILEAMSFKIPIVSMNVGSIKELVKDEKSGYLIEKENYKSFVNRLIELKNNKEHIKLYGEHGFNIIKNNYDISGYVSKLEKIYNDVI